MRGYLPNYELQRERKEFHEFAKRANNRRNEHLELRKLMREYFRETLVDPKVQLPEHIRKAIGLR